MGQRTKHGLGIGFPNTPVLQDSNTSVLQRATCGAPNRSVAVRPPFECTRHRRLRSGRRGRFGSDQPGKQRDVLASAAGDGEFVLDAGSRGRSQRVGQLPVFQ